MQFPARTTPRPLGLVAELTHRCPLRCPYCSNPTVYPAASRELDAVEWRRVFEEASALGVLHALLTGGESSLRRGSGVAGLLRARVRALYEPDHQRRRFDAPPSLGPQGSRPG